MKAAEVLNHWAIELNDICGDLQTEKISQLLWQEQADKLFNKIEMEELLTFIDFEELTAQFKFFNPDIGVNTMNISFPKLAKLPPQTVFIKKILGMRKGRAIVPHGHTNMASAQLILDGTLKSKKTDVVTALQKYGKDHHQNGAEIL